MTNRITEIKEVSRRDNAELEALCETVFHHTNRQGIAKKSDADNRAAGLVNMMEDLHNMQDALIDTIDRIRSAEKKIRRKCIKGEFDVTVEDRTELHHTLQDIIGDFQSFFPQDVANLEQNHFMFFKEQIEREEI